jgi:hypothetical protein
MLTARGAGRKGTVARATGDALESLKDARETHGGRMSGYEGYRIVEVMLEVSVEVRSFSLCFEVVRPLPFAIGRADTWWRLVSRLF